MVYSGVNRSWAETSLDSGRLSRGESYFLVLKKGKVLTGFRIKIVLVQLPFHLGSFGWDIWADISDRKADDKSEVCAYTSLLQGKETDRDKDENVVGYLAHKFASPDGSLSFGSRLWILVLIVTILFSSVHQT